MFYLCLCGFIVGSPVSFHLLNNVPVGGMVTVINWPLVWSLNCPYCVYMMSSDGIASHPKLLKMNIWMIFFSMYFSLTSSKNMVVCLTNDTFCNLIKNFNLRTHDRQLPYFQITKISTKKDILVIVTFTIIAILQTKYTVIEHLIDNFQSSSLK